MVLDNVKIVLVGTTHPGNIGAVARAMKNMTMGRLCLVAPKHFPSADATARASGAHDLLGSAEVCQTLDEALRDCQRVFGASARSRTIRWPQTTPRDCAATIAQSAPEHSTAIVFGREHSGLTNEELDRCQQLLAIPCNPDFSSLNLAAAVQVVAYELFLAHQSLQSPPPPLEPESPLANGAQLESFYQHLDQTLRQLGFIHPDKSGSIMRRLRRLFNRAQLDRKEIDILRGILSAAQAKRHPGED